MPPNSSTNGHGSESNSSHGVPHAGFVRLSRFRLEKGVLLSSLGTKVTAEAAVGQRVPMSPLEEAFGMFLCLVFPGCMVWLPFALAIGAYMLATRCRLMWQLAAVAALAATVFYPVQHWVAAGRSRIARTMFRYTSLSLAWEAPLKPGESYLLVAPPHGVLPVGNILVMLAFPLVWGQPLRGLTTTAALRLPLMRQVMTWIGCVNAASSTAAAHLRNREWLGLCPGGVAEIFETRSNDEVLYIRQRKGFVKLALRTGSALVPCYTFGNTKLLGAWYDKGGVFRSLSRRVGFGVAAVWGRLGLPILFRQPLFAVTGTPIPVPAATPEPTQEQIDHYHNLVLAATEALFEKYKGFYGWGDKRLIIR